MVQDTYKKDIAKKIEVIWRFVIWVIAFLISLSLCLPGIFISLQYSTDECVKGSGTINFALDGWLLVACVFVLSYMIILLIFICLGANDKLFKFFWIAIHIVQCAWYVLGIYLIINSTLKCKHNSLWQMSVAYCCIMGTAWLVETFWMIFKWCGCGCGCGCCKNSVCSNIFDNEETYYFSNIHSYAPLSFDERFTETDDLLV